MHEYWQILFQISMVWMNADYNSGLGFPRRVVSHAASEFDGFGGIHGFRSFCLKQTGSHSSAKGNFEAKIRTTGGEGTVRGGFLLGTGG
jgi:hypothetical protein